MRFTDFVAQQEQTQKEILGGIALPGRRDENWRYSPLTHFLGEREIIPPAARTRAPHPSFRRRQATKSDWATARLARACSAETRVIRIGAGEARSLQLYVSNATEPKHNDADSGKRDFGESSNGALRGKPPRSELPRSKLPRDKKLGNGALELWHEHIEIHVEAGATLKLEDRLECSASTFCNRLLEVWLEEGAVVEHDCAVDHHGVLVNGLSVSVAAGARFVFNTAQRSAGEGFLREDIEVTLQGAGAVAELKGAAIGAGGARTDRFWQCLHQAVNTKGVQNWRQVLHDRAYHAFQGFIEARESGTDSHMLCKQLVLSPTAVAIAKPELDIQHDEVACSHGAATVRLTDDQVFYFASRGIDAATAMALFAQGFLDGAIDNEALLASLKRGSS